MPTNTTPTPEKSSGDFSALDELNKRAAAYKAENDTEFINRSRQLAMSQSRVGVGQIDESQYDQNLSRDEKIKAAEQGNQALDNRRSENQGKLDVLGNAVAKMGVNAAISATTSIPALGLGIIEAVATGDATKLFDNEINRWVKENISDPANEHFKTYQSDAEKEAGFFSSENLLGAGFWDSAISSAGYFVGSGIQAKILGKAFSMAGNQALQNLAKEVDIAAKAGKVPKELKMAFLKEAIKEKAKTATVGALLGSGESAMEAMDSMDSYQQYVDQHNQEIDNQLNTLNSELQAAGGSNVELEQKMADLAYQKISPEQAEEQKKAAGLFNYAVNLALTGAIDLTVFRGALGSKKELATSVFDFYKYNGKEIVEKKFSSGIVNAIAKTGKTVAAYGEIPFNEMIQEGGQFASNLTAQEFIKKRYDKEQQSVVMDLASALGEGVSETIGTKEGLNSMAAGALTSLIPGMGSGYQKQKAEKGAKAAYDAQINNYGGMNNFFNDQFGEVLKTATQTQKTAQELNEATIAGDKKSAITSQTDLAIIHAQNMVKSGMGELYEAKLEALKTLPLDELSKLSGTKITEDRRQEAVKTLSDTYEKVKTYTEQVNSLFSINKFESLVADKLTGTEKEQEAKLKLISIAHSEVLDGLVRQLVQADSFDSRIKSIEQKLQAKNLDTFSEHRVEAKNATKVLTKKLQEAEKALMDKYAPQVDGYKYSDKYSFDEFIKTFGLTRLKSDYAKSEEWANYQKAKAALKEGKIKSPVPYAKLQEGIENLNPALQDEVMKDYTDLISLEQGREALITNYNDIVKGKHLTTIVENIAKIEADKEKQRKENDTNSKTPPSDNKSSEKDDDDDDGNDQPPTGGATSLNKQNDNKVPSNAYPVRQNYALSTIPAASGQQKKEDIQLITDLLLDPTVKLEDHITVEANIAKKENVLPKNDSGTTVNKVLNSGQDRVEINIKVNYKGKEATFFLPIMDFISTEVIAKTDLRNLPLEQQIKIVQENLLDIENMTFEEFKKFFTKYSSKSVLDEQYFEDFKHALNLRKQIDALALNELAKNPGLGKVTLPSALKFIPNNFLVNMNYVHETKPELSELPGYVKNELHPKPEYRGKHIIFSAKDGKFLCSPIDGNLEENRKLLAELQTEVLDNFKAYQNTANIQASAFSYFRIKDQHFFIPLTPKDHNSFGDKPMETLGNIYYGLLTKYNDKTKNYTKEEMQKEIDDLNIFFALQSDTPGFQTGYYLKPFATESSTKEFGINFKLFDSRDNKNKSKTFTVKEYIANDTVAFDTILGEANTFLESVNVNAKFTNTSIRQSIVKATNITNQDNANGFVANVSPDVIRISTYPGTLTYDYNTAIEANAGAPPVYNTKKPNVSTTQSTNTDLEAKKADIERRRQEELEYWQAADRQKRIKEGRETTKKVLENLKKKYPATSFQGIAIRLLEKIIDFNTFAIINSEGLRLPGGQDATKFRALATGEGMAMSQDIIDDLLAGDVNAVKTFIHELVHIFTKEKVGEYQMEKSGLIPGYKAKLTEKEKQAVAELERIYNKVKAQFPSSTEYGLTNLDEFLAEAFSNGSFQGTLKEIKAEGKKTSLFKEWLNAVVDLFYAGLEKWAKRFNKEIPNKSEVTGILEDVMAWTEDLIDDKLIKLEVTTEEINAKYDAELAALNNTTTPTEQPSTSFESLISGSQGIGNVSPDTLKDFDSAGENPFALKLEVDDQVSDTTYKEGVENLKKILPESISTKELSIVERNVGTATAMGKFFTNLNQIGLAEKFAAGTEYHEAFHAVFRKLLTQEEINLYLSLGRKELNYTKEQYAQARENLRTKVAAYRNASDEMLNDLIVEEYLADKYMDWRRDISTKTSSVLKAFFNKLWRFVKWATGNLSKIEKLFYSIDRGQFKSSAIKQNSFSSSDTEVFLLRGKTAKESENIVYQIAGVLIDKITSSKGKENNRNQIEEALDYFANIYNPTSPSNKKILEKNPHLLKKMEWEYLIYAHPKSRAELKSQVGEFLESFDFNIDKESFEIENENLGDRNFDLSFYEVDPADGVPTYFKRFFKTVLVDYKDELTGVTLRRPIDYYKAFTKLQLALAGKPASRKIALFAELAKHNTDIKAAFVKFKEVAQIGRSTVNLPETANIEFINAFHKAFENEKLAYLQLQFADNGDIRLFEGNRNGVGATILNNWQNALLFNKLKVFEKKTAENAYALKLLREAKSAINKYPFKTSEKEVVAKITTAFDYMGIEIPENFIKASLGVYSENEEDVIQYNEAFGDAAMLFTKDKVTKEGEAAYNIIDALEMDLIEGKNPFVTEIDPTTQENIKTGAINRLKNMANAIAMFSDDIYNYSFKAADGKPRYSITLPNYTLVTVNNLANLSESEIADAYYNDPYFKHNPMIYGKSPKEIKEIFANMQVALAGDVADTREYSKEDGETFTRKIGDGTTYRTIDPKTLIDSWMSYFAKASKTKSTKDAWGFSVPFIISDKNTSFAISAPVETGYYVSNGVEMEVTKKAIDKVFNTVFTQEFDRIKHKTVKNMKSGQNSFLYLTELNKNSAISDIIKNVSDLSELTPEQRATINAGIKSALEYEIKGWEKTLAKFDNATLNSLSKIVDNKLAFVGEFVINDILNSAALSQIIRGDLSIAKSSVDWIKRNGGLAAAGTSRDQVIGTNHYKVVYAADNIIYVNKNNRAETITPEDYEKLENKDNYEKITVDDGQVRASLSEYISILSDLAMITKEQREVMTRMDSEDPSVHPTDKEIQEAGIDLIPLKMVTFGKDFEGNEVYHKMSVAPLTRSLVSQWNSQTRTWEALPGKEALHMKLNYMKTHGIDRIVPVSASKSFVGETITDTNINDNSAPRVYNIHKGNDRMQVINESGGGKIKTPIQLDALLPTDLNSTPENKQKILNREQTLADLKLIEFAFARNYFDINTATGEKNLRKFLLKAQSNAKRSGGDALTMELLEMAGDDAKWNANLPAIKKKMTQYFMAHFTKGVLSTEMAGTKGTLLSPAGYNIAVDNEGNVISADEIKRNPEKAKLVAKTRQLGIHKLSADGKTIEVAEVAMTRRMAKMLGVTIGDVMSLDPKALEMLGVRIPTQSHHSMLPFKVVEFLPEEYGDTIIIPPQFINLSGTDFDLDKLYVLRYEYFKQDNKVKRYGTAVTNEEKFAEYKAYWASNSAIKDEVEYQLELNESYQKNKKNLNAATLDKDWDLVKAIKVDNEYLENEAIRLAMKDFKLVTTQEEFNALPSNKQTNPAALKNKYLEISLDLAKSPELIESYHSPANTEELVNAITALKVAGADIEENNYSPVGPTGKLNAFIAVNTGKDGVGPAAASNTTSAVLTKLGIKLKKGFGITIDNKEFNSFASSKMDDIIFTIDEKNETVSVSIENDTKRKGDMHSNHISSAVDNANKMEASSLNLNADAQGIAGVADALSVGNRISIILKQPIMDKFYNKLLTSNNKMEVLNKMIESKEKELDDAVITKLKTTPEDQIEAVQTKYSKFDKLTTQDLINRFKSKDVADNAHTDLSVLYIYRELNKIANTTSHVRAIAALNKGFDSTFEGFDDVIESVKKLGMHPEYRLTYKDKQDLAFDPEILKQSPLLKANVQMILEAEKDAKKLFMRKTTAFNMIKDLVSDAVRNTSGKYGEAFIDQLETYLTMRMVEKKSAVPLSSYQTKLYKTPGSKTFKEEHLALKEKLENNLFYKLLDPKTKGKFGFDTVQINTFNKLSPETTKLITESYQELIKSSDPEIKQYAISAIQYLVAKDNLQFKAGSMIRFIGLDAFKNLNTALDTFIKSSNISTNNNPEVLDALMKELTGNSMKELAANFIELYARSKKNFNNIQTHSFNKKSNPNDKVESGDGVVIKAKIPQEFHASIAENPGKSYFYLQTPAVKMDQDYKGNNLLTKELDLVNVDSGFETYEIKNLKAKPLFVNKHSTPQGTVSRLFKLVKRNQKITPEGTVYEFLYREVPTFSLSQETLHFKTADEAQAYYDRKPKTATVSGNDFINESGETSTDITTLTSENNNYYEGDIKPEPNTIFVFGSNPEGRHGAGAAKVAKEQFGAIYGQGEGLQGNSYALPTKDLRVKNNNSLKSIKEETIINSIKKLYEVAKQNPNKQFKIAYRNTTEISLNGYTGLEMIEMFNQAGSIPNNIIFSKEWFDTNLLNINKSKPTSEAKTTSTPTNDEMKYMNFPLADMTPHTFGKNTQEGDNNKENNIDTNCPTNN